MHNTSHVVSNRNTDNTLAISSLPSSVRKEAGRSKVVSERTAQALSEPKYPYKKASLYSIPKTPGLPRIGQIQPLPGLSYLATSTSYYEM